MMELKTQLIKDLQELFKDTIYDSPDGTPKKLKVFPTHRPGTMMDHQMQMTFHLSPSGAPACRDRAQTLTRRSRCA